MRQPSKAAGHQAEAGFAIGIDPQDIIEGNARDKFEDTEYNPDFQRETLKLGLMDNGAITESGWRTLNEDIRRIERNSMRWVRTNFLGARDEGHDKHADLVGTFWFDASNPDQAHLVELAADTGRQERIDMVDLSYGDLAKTVFDGVTDFGGSVLGGSITFFDVKPEDMETIEATLEMVRRRAHGAREVQRRNPMSREAHGPRAGRGMPNENIFWRNIPAGSRVALIGHSYVVTLPDGRRASAYWEGNDAVEAQQYLDSLVRRDTRPTPSHPEKHPRARRR